VTVPVLAAAVPVGALGTAILAVNNLRDAATDAKAGKRTLVVRLGIGAGKAEYVAMLALAFATPILFVVAGWATPWVLLALVAVPAAAPPLRRVLREEGRALNPALGETARLQLIFALLFSVALAFGRSS
jgi:1,4-dihydroxy-2-naphthoate octaprenyltransferase